ncbi:nuclear transport factor 2 family protein [Nonomuraea jabiensis]|uniref:Bifunctional aromatase (Cyclase/dehydratase) n=1 Tax=Nonomuraea jabiensis TaxID=882448 RepID=A0A7W9GGK2_9ACTN|nr:nuclear transport factor 2 family protein [Nonomuraea jabiensis]MBB5783201.1 bifunctional aromatase (cyclase/dehydratase) [Nonomuraea jabiensis]
MSRPLSPGGLYAEIQAFYARQTRLLDRGRTDEWAATFTEDGVFEEVVKGERLEGREAIAASARKRADATAAEGVQRRHWFGMLEVDHEADGRLGATYYALVMSTPTGGGLAVYLSAEAHDVLVPHHDGWLVSHRSIRHDAAGPLESEAPWSSA